MTTNIDDTQNWKTLRVKHQVTCKECEALICLLEQENAGLKQINALNANSIEEGRKENERLRRLLQEYGEHQAQCYLRKEKDGWRFRCRCGLEAALEEGKK